MAPRKPETRALEIEVAEVRLGQITVGLVGTSPFVCNRQSEKVKAELLIPKGPKTAAAKAQSVKHDVLQEFRDSPYTIDDDNAPTLLAFRPVAFKRAMMTAALDIPGAKKAQIGRLVRAEGERTPLYGAPELLMTDVRQAGMNRTPDIRTRAIVPQWAVLLEITFAMDIIREKSVLNLLAAAGLFSGVGDWRTEKGSGNYGSFRVAGVEDPELQDILAAGGRQTQVVAMNTPVFYDDETERLFTIYRAAVTDRGLKVVA